jgi:hypothetical protein
VGYVINNLLQDVFWLLEFENDLLSCFLGNFFFKLGQMWRYMLCMCFFFILQNQSPCPTWYPHCPLHGALCLCLVNTQTLLEKGQLEFGAWGVDTLSLLAHQPSSLLFLAIAHPHLFGDVLSLVWSPNGRANNGSLPNLSQGIHMWSKQVIGYPSDWLLSLIVCARWLVTIADWLLWLIGYPHWVVAITD